MTKKLVIGTRGSRLALIQANIVRDRLLKAKPQLEVELEVIKTSGDRFKDIVLAEIGGKELFTKEIDEALLTNRIDLAVHSLKDVAGFLPDGVQITAVLKRENPQDALISEKARTIDDLPHGCVVGTCSPRRKAQLLIKRPDLVVKPIRGNVPGRIEKVESGDYDATILAAAGLKRIGRQGVGSLISEQDMVPAIAQGTIGITTRQNDSATNEIVDLLNHTRTMAEIVCERQVLIAFGGSCFTPVAAVAKVNCTKVDIDAIIAEPEGKDFVRITKSCDLSESENVGQEIGYELFEKSRKFLG